MSDGRRIALAAVVVAASACGTPQDFMTPGGPAARLIAHLGWAVLIAFVVTTVVVWALLVWAATRRPGTFAEHAPIDDRRGQSWILIGGLLVPAITFCTFFVWTLRTMAAFPMHDHGHDDPDDAEIRVIGHQWWWDVVYPGDRPSMRTKTANEVHIPVGRPVDIALDSVDVIHSFWVPKLHGKVDLIPGMTNHIRIQADAPGTYRGECGEYCGEQHAHMVVVVVAHPPAEYDAWLAAQRRPAASPSGEEARHGEQVFMNGPCPLCHAVRGTPARGAVAPDLTHFGSRLHVASWLPNDTADLAAWITHAQSLKPGARMPDLAQFTGTELRAVTTYLQALK